MNKEEILRGTIGVGMPTPEEEFKRVTGEDFDPERYSIEWSGAENYGEDDTYTPYRIVRRVSKDNDLESSNNYSEDEIRRAYDNAVSNAIALINLPEPTDSYEREAYNDEYLRRSEEIRRDLEILSDEQIREAEAEIARRTHVSNDLTDDLTSDLTDDLTSDLTDEVVVNEDDTKESVSQNEFENYSNEDIDNRLREIWEEVSTFSDELTVDDPLYIEYWNLVGEKKRREEEKAKESDHSDLSDEDIERRLRELSQDGITTDPEMDENDPAYKEYWALLNEKNRRKKEKAKEPDYSDLSDEDIERRLGELWQDGIATDPEMDENDPAYKEYWALINEKNRRKKEKVVDSNGLNDPSDKDIKDAIERYINESNEKDDSKDDSKDSLGNENENENENEKHGGNGIITIPPENISDIEIPHVPKKNEKHGIIRRVFSKFNLIPLIATVTALVVSAFGHTAPKKVTTEDVKNELISNVSYSVSTPDEEKDVYETVEEAVKRKQSELKTGDTVYIGSDIDYHYSSDWDNQYANDIYNYFGKEPTRPAGEYTLDYVSIVDPASGNTIRAVEYKQGSNVEDFIDKACKDLGKSRDEVKIRVAIGGPASGWIDYDDYVSCIKDGHIDKQLLRTEVIPGKVYKGTEDNFVSEVTFKDENGRDTIINFKKSDGTYYQVGDEVTASNGQTYRIDQFDIDTRNVPVTETHTTTEKSKLTFKLSNISPLEAIASAAISLIGIPLTYRRRREEEEATEDEFENIANLNGYKSDGNGTYYRNWWEFLTHNREGMSFVPDEELEENTKSR